MSIPKRRPAEMALLAAEIILGKHFSSSAVIFRRARKIAVRSRPGMRFNVDGELVGRGRTGLRIVPRERHFGSKCRATHASDWKNWTSDVTNCAPQGKET